MPTYLQPVVVPERCFLFEALLWIAFQRLPLVSLDHEGVDFRESTECQYENEASTELPQPRELDEYLSDEECAYAKILPDPSWHALIEEKVLFSNISEFPRFGEAKKEFADRLAKERKEAAQLDAEIEAWKKSFDQALELPSHRLFVALRDGLLSPSGKLLPDLNLKKALAKVSRREEGAVFYIDPTPIAPNFWSFKGIDFKASAARSSVGFYCFITVVVDELLSAFPKQGISISGVERVGDLFFVNDASVAPAPVRLARGRPSFQWNDLHQHVRELQQNNQLPAKKEAAIELLRDWFEQKFRVRPGRTAMGMQLTRYYGGSQK